MQFLFVRPRFCLQLLLDSASRRTPLSLANSSYCQACSGLSPPSYYACRAHHQKEQRRRNSAAVLLFLLCFCFKGLPDKIVFVKYMLLIIILLLNYVFGIIFVFGSYRNPALQNLGYRNGIYFVHCSSSVTLQDRVGLTPLNYAPLTPAPAF